MKRVSRRVRPQRETSGIVLPEFALFAALQSLPGDLASGKYGYDAAEEPIVKEIVGLSTDLLESTFISLQRNPPLLSLYLQRDRQQLPSIIVHPESMDTVGRSLGDHAGIEDEDIEVVTDTILTPEGGAVGGETRFRLPTSPVVMDVTKIEIERSGETLPLYLGAYPDYTIDEDGLIVLTDPLVAGDVLTASRWAYYGLPGGERLGAMYNFTHVVFVEALNPLVTGVLTALVWRELMQRYTQLQTAGLTDLDISRRSQSLWEDRMPPLGFRSEIVVSGYVEWSTYKRVEFPRTLTIDLDSTDGEESVLVMSCELASLGTSAFLDEE